MTMGKELTLGQNQEVGFAIPPDIVLANAMTAAKALMSVVSLKKRPVIMNGEQYLEFDDWQTCGQFYGYTVRTGDAIPVEVDGVKGAKAHADLINLKTGEIVGGAEAYCMRDEEHWNTRPKYEWQGEGGDRKKVKAGDEIVPWFQLASMAQTRAGAKAFRNRLAWVVVLAGYKATPAEEMTENTVISMEKERRTVDKSEHWCELHKTPFFKKGKMLAYAHPIGDTGEWCHEHKEKPTPEAKNQPAESKDTIQEGQASPDEDSKAESTVTVGAPANLGELCTWVTSHKDQKTGKPYTTRWLYSQFSFQEKELQEKPEKIADAYAEVKQMMNWD